MYTYLLINFFTILVPFTYSFDRRIQFYKTWKFLFPAMTITGALFIAWDIYFTYRGIWGFNPRYLTGIEFLNLPLEEWLFFIAIPYACVFTYQALKYFIPKDILGPYQKLISWTMIIGFTLLGIIHLDKSYTSTTFLLNAVFLLILQLWLKPGYLGRFYLSYLILLIPFFMVNGVLTGSWMEEQVVWYDDRENLGVRLGTIPVEDIFYGMLLILMNVVIYEKLKSKKPGAGTPTPD